MVEDLEALKELNDELEESHVETEKQMQEELGTSELSLPFLPLADLALLPSPFPFVFPVPLPISATYRTLRSPLDQISRTSNCATSTFAAMPSKRVWRITRRRLDSSGSWC